MDRGRLWMILGISIVLLVGFGLFSFTNVGKAVLVPPSGVAFPSIAGGLPLPNNEGVIDRWGAFIPGFLELLTFDEIVDNKFAGENNDCTITGNVVAVNGLISGGAEFRKGRCSVNIDVDPVESADDSSPAGGDDASAAEATYIGRTPPRMTTIISKEFSQPFVGRAHLTSCTNNFAFGVWVYPSDDNKGVIAQADGVFELGLDETVKWSVGSSLLQDTGVYLPIDDWTHVALVFNQGHMKVYFDGKPQEEVLIESCAGIFSSITFGENLVARLDDAVVYNRDLFNHEIQQMVNRGLQIEPLDYVSRWEFDVDASDEAGRHDGIIIGEESTIEVLNPDSTKEEGYLRIPGVSGNYVQVGEVSEVAVSGGSSGGFSDISGGLPG
jgi:hypothetical protein